MEPEEIVKNLFLKYSNYIFFTGALYANSPVGTQPMEIKKLNGNVL
jgi:hypothetical protein